MEMQLTHLLTVLFALCVAGQNLSAHYVIAGGGTAGLVLANRLSANPAIQVVVIEPGDDVRNDPSVKDVDTAGITFSPLLDWNYTSTIQPQLDGRTLSHSAGKAIGGTTVINGLIYIRGDAAEFDAWEMLGNWGWNWNTLFSDFLISEDFTVPTTAQHDAGASYVPQYHGKGQTKVGFPYQLDNGTFHNVFDETFQRLGFDVNQDLNGGKTRGYGSYPQTVDRDVNVRETSARAYYEPVESRENLKIIKGTAKIITWAQSCDSKLIASGIEYVDGRGNWAKVTAIKEVILSTGTLVSPLILEASGIGNPNVLNRNKIETKLALPGVGEGFQEQPLSTLIFDTTLNITGHIPFVLFATAQDLFGDDTADEAAATKAALPSWSRAVSQRLNGSLSPEVLETRFQVQHDVMFNKNATVAEFEFFAFGNISGLAFWNTIPFSWGSVHLNSLGEVNNPTIDTNLLSLDGDVRTAIAAGRLGLKAWSSPPLSDQVLSFVAPGDAVLPSNATDAQWAAYLASAVTPAYHGIGTCAMLPRDLGGVVDSTLKVYGTRNVRVVDASVIPHLMSGHTSATVYALSEKAAHLILGND